MAQVKSAAPARGGRIVILVAALAAALLTARLGWWQWDRAAQKLALQTTLDSRAGLPVVGAAELVADGRDELYYRRVKLRGRWLVGQTVYLDNRQMNARPGFIVVTPLQWAGAAVLVQRGWVARDSDARTHLPVLDTPAGEVEVVGRVAPPPGRLYEFSAAASGAIRQNIDPTAYSREIGLTLLPLSVLQEDASAADGLLRQWPAPAVDIHKHYGYAFQWWAMSALITGLYVWFQVLRPR